MRHVAHALFVAGCLSFAGCAQFDAVTAELTKPQTVAALAVVKDGVHTLTCGLSAAAAASAGVAAQNYNGNPIVDPQGQQIIAIVYASSQAACALTGGVVVSTQ